MNNTDKIIEKLALINRDAKAMKLMNNIFSCRLRLRKRYPLSTLEELQKYYKEKKRICSIEKNKTANSKGAYGYQFILQMPHCTLSIIAQ